MYSREHLLQWRTHSTARFTWNYRRSLSGKGSRQTGDFHCKNLRYDFDVAGCCSWGPSKVFPVAYFRALLIKELESVGIRLNAAPPNVYFRKCKTGGISFTSMVPLPQIDEKLVLNILHEYRIFHCELIIREGISVDTLIDVIVGNRKYLKCLFVYNKIDQLSLEELDALAHQSNTVVISSEHRWNFDVLVESIWNKLELLRIYTKKPGSPPDFVGGELIVRKGSTVEHVCHSIHRTLPSKFKYALVWGSSTKHQPQRVGLTHKVEDEDVIQIVKKTS